MKKRKIKVGLIKREEKDPPAKVVDSLLRNGPILHNLICLYYINSKTAIIIVFCIRWNARNR